MDQRILIAQLNIDHYRRTLATEQDVTKRQTLVRLLAEEETKLAVLNDPPGDNKQKDESSFDTEHSRQCDGRTENIRNCRR